MCIVVVTLVTLAFVITAVSESGKKRLELSPAYDPNAELCFGSMRLGFNGLLSSVR